MSDSSDALDPSLVGDPSRRVTHGAGGATHHDGAGADEARAGAARTGGETARAVGAGVLGAHGIEKRSAGRRGSERSCTTSR